MHISRRDFIGSLSSGAASLAVSGCVSSSANASWRGRIALQLYSIVTYIGGEKDKNGRVLVPGVGMATALEKVAAIGYAGVEFAGYGGLNERELNAVLKANGLKACGTHVGNDQFGFNVKNWTIDLDVMKRICDFNMSYGNNLLICPGGNNFPPGVTWTTGRLLPVPEPSIAIDDFTLRLADLYNKGAEEAAKFGCRIGLHNHMWEHKVKMTDGASFWDRFFSNTSDRVCMEQDVGWTVASGLNPSEQYRKYPHRAPTLHAKENGLGEGVMSFEGVVGCPGKPGATPVDWDDLIRTTERDGVEWYVVECEKHFEDFSAVLPSYNYLKAKGLD